MCDVEFTKEKCVDTTRLSTKKNLKKFNLKNFNN